METGFVPCFARYSTSYTLSPIFADSMTLTKTKELMTALLEAKGQYELKQLTGQEIKPMRKGQSNEMDRVLKHVNFPEGTPIRIDYGKNKFRVVLGLSNEPRGKIAYIFMISNDHVDFNGKQKK